MNVALRAERSLDIISICTGGGGLDLGVELAIPCARSVCMVEREAFAVAQLVAAMDAGHLAPSPVWSDARTFDGKPWRGLVDGFIGGIPCQPHSLAGRKRGQHDPRDLWSDARRIIVQSRPWFVLIENVAGMLAAGDDEIAGAERVWRDLRKLGFAVEGGLFTAAEVGASHERERIFILGVADASDARLQGRKFSGPSGERDWSEAYGSASELRRASLEHSPLIGRGEGRAEPELRSGRDTAASAERRRSGLHQQQHLADTYSDEQASIGGDAGAGQGAPQGDRRTEHRPSLSGGFSGPLFPPGPSDLDGWRRTLERAPELEPAFRRVADGLASRLDIARVDRLRLLGNGVVPLAAAHALRTLVARLARRGSAGAVELARMMEVA